MPPSLNDLVVLDVALPDHGSGLLSRIFAAICGIVVSAMRAAGPDHGAGSQGVHSSVVGFAVAVEDWDHVVLRIVEVHDSTIL